ECGCPGLLAYVLEELERGIRSWDVDPGICSIDKQLKLFVSGHSTTFSSLVKGQRSFHHRGDTLETLVLLNPSHKSLCDELRNLLLDPTPHKLLVLAGPCLEKTGELLLQTGGFSPYHFLQVLKDKEIHDLLSSTPPPSDPPTLTITCPTFGNWAGLAPDVPGLQGVLRLRLNPPAQLPTSEGLREFLSYLNESLEPPSLFELLEPPSSGGFLRIPEPCCYIFPGGLGDAAFFAVNGFTVLVDGGSNPKSSFWKLVRHLDRVDAVLVTHAGADSLPGLNSLLRRKLAERPEVAANGSLNDRLRRLISPNLGVVFFNACEAASRLVRGQDEAEVALGLLAQLGITPLPLSRGPLPPKPIVLFQKVGVGRLDMHVLQPPSAGPERASASVCVLLVWHPADPTEKVLRVLFPGCTPPARLLEGLAHLQHLKFLREPEVTPQDLEGPRRAESKESVGSRDSLRKDGRASAPSRLAQERPRGARKEPLRAEAPRRTEKDAKSGPQEVKKDSRTSVARTQPREVRRVPSAAANVKKVGAPVAPKLRKAPSMPNPGFGSVENGPCSLPALPHGDTNPVAASCNSPASQLEATPSLDSNLELGLSPAGDESSCFEEKMLLVSDTPRPRTPSPTERAPSPTEGSGRLSLSPLRSGEAGPDTSPTATTPTVTTPSLPAEVGSPHSTEVDESLSVSFEQVLPPPPSAGEAGLSLPLRGPRARRSVSPHDVDLCLVSPCEFEHRKAVPTAPASPGSSNDSSARSQERAGVLGVEETPPTSISESLPTLSDSDPLPAIPGAADSDNDLEGLGGALHDPLPDPVKVPPPLPDPPGICMVDPEMVPPKSARQTENPGPSRKPVARPSSGGTAPKAAPAAATKAKGLASGDRASRPLSARSEPSDKGGRAPLSRKPSVPKTATRAPSGAAGSRPAARSAPPPGFPVYLDLAYLPGGSSASLVDEAFFRQESALCYVISGQDQRKEEGMRPLLDALLAGKQRWDRDLQVTLIPTFDSAAMHTWYEETHTRHQALGLVVLGSNSMVSMQDDAFPGVGVARRRGRRRRVLTRERRGPLCVGSAGTHLISGRNREGTGDFQVPATRRSVGDQAARRGGAGLQVPGPVPQTGLFFDPSSSPPPPPPPASLVPKPEQTPPSPDPVEGTHIPFLLL
ncbi:microtubule-associated protein 1S, partial [Tupaia chinensis]|uniref:microtubule-associated protein 1S n=1 Tax=Tupaia chinensis TaxID=246437 RepID=UPI000FFCA272